MADHVVDSREEGFKERRVVGLVVAQDQVDRGRLAGLFQFNIVLGIVIAYLSNALLAGVGDNAWRWMMGVAAFPSLLYAVLCLGIPESPR